MQQLLKQVLALTRVSEQAQWQAVETSIIETSESFDPSTLSQVAVHFALSEQGTQDFWKSIDNTTVATLDNFTGEELIQVSHAFMLTDYEVSDALDKKLGDGLSTWFESELNANKKKNPFTVPDEIENIQAALQYVGGPGFNTTYTQGGRIFGNHRTGVMSGSNEEEPYTTEQLQLIEDAEKINQQLVMENRVSIKDLLGIK